MKIENREPTATHSLVYTKTMAQPMGRATDLFAEQDTASSEETVQEIVKDLNKIIRWPQLARPYFGKSEAWLYHKFQGIHNGKPFYFNHGERKILKTALLDISERMRLAAEKL